jgi:hypothetical protein
MRTPIVEHFPSFVNLKHPHHISVRSILILYFHLCVGLLSGLFLSGLQTRTIHVYLISRTRPVCPTYLILPDFSTLIMSGSVTRTNYGASHGSFSHSPVIHLSLVQFSVVRTLFSNTLTLCSSLSMTDQV